jgi:hypothetical protein
MPSLSLCTIPLNISQITHHSLTKLLKLIILEGYIVPLAQVYVMINCECRHWNIMSNLLRNSIFSNVGLNLVLKEHITTIVDAPSPETVYHLLPCLYIELQEMS